MQPVPTSRLAHPCVRCRLGVLSVVITVCRVPSPALNLGVSLLHVTRQTDLHRLLPGGESSVILILRVIYSVARRKGSGRVSQPIQCLPAGECDVFDSMM